MPGDALLCFIVAEVRCCVHAVCCAQYNVKTRAVGQAAACWRPHLHAPAELVQHALRRQAAPTAVCREPAARIAQRSTGQENAPWVDKPLSVAFAVPVHAAPGGRPKSAKAYFRGRMTAGSIGIPVCNTSSQHFLQASAPTTSWLPPCYSYHATPHWQSSPVAFVCRNVQTQDATPTHTHLRSYAASFHTTQR